MKRAYYSGSIAKFIEQDKNEILGQLTCRSQFEINQSQITAWREEICIMKKAMTGYPSRGKIYLEYEIPRLGGRIDVLVLIDGVIFVIEFKVGHENFTLSAVDQVYDYALDLKNFHETSHSAVIAPIVVATKAENGHFTVKQNIQKDNLLECICVNSEALADAISTTLKLFADDVKIDIEKWESGRYNPTPTIIESATALYGGHSVKEISRNDAGAKNLGETLETVANVIQSAQENFHKAICFVTGVPGAGKTLVGLEIATRHMDKNRGLHSVFLSGNGPLVKILREALARDKVRREKQNGNTRPSISEARREVKAFIQNVHHFRDDCIKDESAPTEHVALFDEAQRAWDKQQTANFMKRKKNIVDFKQSEPEFLISCLERHSDWAVVVCLVGGGQEINTGEAGIEEWFSAINRRFPQWHVYVSPQLMGGEYGVETTPKPKVFYKDELHLSVSMRSFRAENVSLLIKQILDLEIEQAKRTLGEISEQYPIVLTRDLSCAKKWLRQQARGSERYGMVVSSRAERLKPHAVDVRPTIDPIHWFLEGKEDVRSSYYLEDVATEFHIQGLEIDWACLVWDADFRYTTEGWEHWSFQRGRRWNRINKPERQTYLKNAYRVLLTRARQGMVIVVPEGSEDDSTRDKSYYDSTFNYLKNIGFRIISN